MNRNIASLTLFTCFLIFIFISCRKDQKLFELIPPPASGITFNNLITESDSLNILDYEYIYNGGGVAVGDFNSDGLPDLYFVGNMVSNELYLNQDDFTFKNITSESGTGGATEKWYSGASVVDINNDGLPDIYLSATGRNNPELRKNELYINHGLNGEGIPVFEERAEQYGLADNSYTTMAAFFDSNNDGNLEIYLLTSHRDPNQSYAMVSNQRKQKIANRDKMFRIIPEAEEDHPIYREVSDETGITKGGHGLGINITDINFDGFKDIYIANDYISEDILWINNGDGTYTDKIGDYLKHSSYSAMGTDIADINNDGLPDIFTLDMLPEINFRKNTMTNPNNYRNYLNQTFEQVFPQYTRNTMQLNMGAADKSLQPFFSEIAFLSGIAETDWSWTPLLADFNNNGYRDLVITNGIPKDVTDKDFWNEYGKVTGVMPKSMALRNIPEVKISNYAFINNKDLTFTDYTDQWGLNQPSFSTGAIYADLNNDGALDIIINNVNEPAFIYKNNLLSDPGSQSNHFLKIIFEGDSDNRNGLGAVTDLYYNDGEHQTHEHSLYRGYLSTVDPVAHFGLGDSEVIDSLVVTWHDSAGAKREIKKNVSSDQTITVKKSDAIEISLSNEAGNRYYQHSRRTFLDVITDLNISYIHSENEFNDFASEPLLPYKLSQLGPGLAAGDISGNGLDDIFIGGAFGENGSVLFQTENGKFDHKEFLNDGDQSFSQKEDTGVLLFDANNDGHNDLYIASGSIEHPSGSEHYQDNIFLNDGNANFIHQPDALPKNPVSSSVVTAADFNSNGKPDLFIGGFVSPGKYPEPVSSSILRNDSEMGELIFTDVTSEVAPGLNGIGMVTDALWSDFDNDGLIDLIVTGLWMPVSFFRNTGEGFENVTEQTGIRTHSGWWNSITGGDFTNNGFTDYVVGNHGLNSFYRASEEEPMRVYAGDLNDNGLYDAVITTFKKDSDGTLKEFPVHNFQQMQRVLPQITQNFSSNEEYGKTAIHDFFSAEQLEKATVWETRNLKTSILINNGDGTFSIHPLPHEAQVAPVYGFLSDDFDNDGNLDLLLTGNHFGADIRIGRYDALNGLHLKGDGTGSFSVSNHNNSGFYLPGDGKSLIKLKGTDNNYLVAASQNNGPLKIFRRNNDPEFLTAESTDAYAIIYFESGKQRKNEFYYGSSFLSASSRFIPLTENMTKIELVKYDGKRRTVNLR